MPAISLGTEWSRELTVSELGAQICKLRKKERGKKNNRRARATVSASRY